MKRAGRVRRCFLLLGLLLGSSLGMGVSFARAEPARAEERVRAAVEHWRDRTSYTEARMIIHRPEWERSMRLRAWTEGMEKSLVRFTAPPKDAGSASLKIGSEMWSYSPKVNRVIKIPPSMMAQSWMGSDFSYKDLAKADDIIDQYRHRIISSEQHEGQHVDVIESVPLEDAPIVWGKEVLKIRADNVIVEHVFYDQDGRAVKRLTARKIEELGGKIYPTIMRMEHLEEEGRWTQLEHEKAEFGVDLSPSLFTLSNLRNPRQ